MPQPNLDGRLERLQLQGISMRTNEVFGIATTYRPVSYIDRGELDEVMQDHLNRDEHIALRGESKCGKSWFRQKNIPNAIVVQCRLGRAALDLYEDALAKLDIRLELERTQGARIKGTAKAIGEAGFKLIAKATGEVSGEVEWSRETTSQLVGHNIDDLGFIATILRESGKRLIIEDFHYLGTSERSRLAFELKALWDLGVYVVIIGVWSQSNMLFYLNPDLTGRVHEISIEWSNDDLKQVLAKGGEALNITFTEAAKNHLASLCYSNVGILQHLALDTLLRAGFREKEGRVIFDNRPLIDDAAMFYADQLNPLYQQFADRVSRGIRKRSESTGIYAHAMAVIMAATDDELIRGLRADDVYEKAHLRQNRIQKGNLKSVLQKFESLQVDDDGRGLVIAYNPATETITTVDRQVLLYRRFSTVAWPWEELVRESESDASANAGE